MVDFKIEITKVISNVCKIEEKDLIEFVEIPPNSDLGDYAFPCFRLAKQFKQSPIVIAQQLKKEINLDNNIIQRVEAVGGYLNFYINKKLLAQTVLNEISEKKQLYGSCNIGNGKNVVIEYSSPNIAKPFHIGHLRTTVIGGALYKIYNFLGYNSIGINYLGDWGLQFGKVMAGMSMWKDEYDFTKNEIDSILKIYVRFSSKEKEEPEIINLARDWFKRLENGEQHARTIWEWIRKISIENYEKTYKLLNSKFDLYRGEAYYNDKIQEVVEELKEKGLLKESQGAQVVDLEAYDMPPCIVITSAGTSIYATRDIAALIDRIKMFDFAKMLYIVGNEQQLHFRQFFKVLELMGYGEYVKNSEHVSFGLVVDKYGEKIGSRKGNSVSLEDILQESINKVKKIIEEKNPSLLDKEDVAKKVGIGAIVFNDLSNSRVKDETFDWDMILNFNGETGPYIQYTYVRAISILEKVQKLPVISEIDFSKIQDTEAISVLKLLYCFTDIVKNAGDKNEPSIISRYLIDLAQSYSTFYNQHQIIGKEKSVQDARVYLTYCVSIVLKTGCGLLGIDMPNRM